MYSVQKIKQAFQVKKLNRQILLLMIATITIPLLVMSAFIYFTSVQAVRSEYQNSSGLILNNLSFNIDQYLQSIEKGTLGALMDSELQVALEHVSQQDTINANDVRLQHGNVIESFVSSIEMSIKNVDSVQIYTGDRVFYSANFNRSDYNIDDVTNQEWYKQTIAHEGGIVIFGTHKPYHRVNASESVISIARVINKIGTKQPLSVMLIDIRLDSLREILNISETTNRKFLIVDNKDNVIYASDPSLENADLRMTDDILSNGIALNEQTGSFYASVNGVQSYVNFVSSPYSNWRVFQYIADKEMIKHAERVQNIVLVLAVCSLGTAILFMFLLTARVTKPIIQLSRQVKLVGLGKFDVNIQSNRRDEFGVLYQGIRKMVDDLQQFIERSSLAKAQQKMAQYGALKSQINPHFLANTLESIQMKAVINGDRETSEMIGLLGQLFRSFIRTGKETVTLQDELSLIRIYIKVQQMRFGSKIQYNEYLAPASEQGLILHFSLQPLIENAIVHGIERKIGPGRLEITTTITGNDLFIMIRDDGAGMSEEQLQFQLKRLDEPSDTLDEEHIGIKNVHDRIRYYYGEQYGITLQSQPGSGTTVTLRIPYRRA